MQAQAGSNAATDRGPCLQANEGSTNGSLNQAKQLPAHLQDVVCREAVVAATLAPANADGLAVEQRAVKGAQVGHLWGRGRVGEG